MVDYTKDPLAEHSKERLQKKEELRNQLIPFLQTRVKLEWTKLKRGINKALDENNPLISSGDIAGSIMKVVADIYDYYIYTTTSLLFEGIHINIMGDYVELCTQCKLPCLELDAGKLCHNCRDQDKEDPIPSCWSCYGRM